VSPTTEKTKSTPALSVDPLRRLARREVIWRTADNKEAADLYDDNPTTHRFVTLMHDPQYRLAIAWQNVAYNQAAASRVSTLAKGMAPPPRPNIVLVGAGKLVAGMHVALARGSCCLPASMSLAGGRAARPCPGRTNSEAEMKTNW